MAERQQRQRLRTLRNNRQLARFVVEGRATGKQLGTGSYGSVEEVGIMNLSMQSPTTPLPGNRGEGIRASFDP